MIQVDSSMECKLTSWNIIHCASRFHNKQHTLPLKQGVHNIITSGWKLQFNYNNLSWHRATKEGEKKTKECQITMVNRKWIKYKSPFLVIKKTQGRVKGIPLTKTQEKSNATIINFDNLNKHTYTKKTNDLVLTKNKSKTRMYLASNSIKLPHFKEWQSNSHK